MPFEATTATFAVDPSLLDPDATAVQGVAVEQELETEQMPAITTEQTLFDEPLPLPPPRVAEPAYLVEVRTPQGAPRLLAMRDSLDDALRVASSVHPSVADVVIRELPLPCDAQSFLGAFAGARSWAREPNGAWVER